MEQPVCDLNRSYRSFNSVRTEMFSCGSWSLQIQKLGVIVVRHGSRRQSAFFVSSTLWLLLQEQQQQLSTYQSLVVKQLVSQSQSKKQEEAEGEANTAEEQNEEARSVRAQLMSLTPQVKDLVLSQKKTLGTEE